MSDSVTPVDRATALDGWPQCVSREDIETELIKRALALRNRGVPQRGGEDLLLEAISKFPNDIHPTAEAFAGICNWRWTNEIAEPEVPASENAQGAIKLRTHEDRLRERLSPGPMIIADLCPEGGIAAMVAMPGVGKTLIAAALTECIATGQSFAGHAVARGSVLYVCSDSPASTESRFLALSDEAAKSVFTITEMLSLPSGMAALRQAAIDAKALSGAAVKLIVYDTWDSSREHSSGGYADQDGGAEVIMRGLRTIATELKCAVLILHHATRQDNGRARGTVVFDARCDWIANVEKGASGLVLKSTKCRDGECGIVGTWSIVPVQVGKRSVPTLVEAAADRADLVILGRERQLLEANFSGTPMRDGCTYCGKFQASQRDGRTGRSPQRPSVPHL